MVEFFSYVIVGILVGFLILAPLAGILIILGGITGIFGAMTGGPEKYKESNGNSIHVEKD